MQSKYGTVVRPGSVCPVPVPNPPIQALFTLHVMSMTWCTLWSNEAVFLLTAHVLLVSSTSRCIAAVSSGMLY